MLEHDAESPWYRRCIEVGTEDVDALDEVSALALDNWNSSRKYFASLWSLRFDAAQSEGIRAYPELSNSDLFLLAKGLVLLEKSLREKNRSYTFGSASPVVPICRLLEFRLMPKGRDALNGLYVWIHLHKDQENPYTPFGSLAYSNCITLEDRERVERYAKFRSAVHEREAAEQKRQSKERRQHKAAVTQRKKETRGNTNDVVIIDYGEDGIYISRSWAKRFSHRVKNFWGKVRARVIS